VKTVQITINSGGNMSKSEKKAPTRKGSLPRSRKSGEVLLTASQNRLLKLLETGTDTEEPSVLAAGRL
jgi:hypothetical protein